MRLPDDLLESVAFIAVDLGGGEVVYGGTAFLVHVPFESTAERGTRYIVTARHVITDLRQHGRLQVRFNLVGGGVRLYDVSDGWVFHPDEAVDLATAPITLPAEVKARSLPFDTFITDAKAAAGRNGVGIGVGDEIAMTGLFHQREGYSRNVPIMRSGIIAAMPDEPLIDKQERPFDGYLLEVRSIGGLSGSPVFVILTPNRMSADASPEPEPTQVHLYLLGVVRGHWNQSGLLSLNAKPSFLDIEQFNAGIAVATPMQKVAELLEVEDLMKGRKDQESNFLAKRAPVDDSVIPHPNEGSEFKRFEDLARSLVQVPKSELDDARERESD